MKKDINELAGEVVALTSELAESRRKYALSVDVIADCNNKMAEMIMRVVKFAGELQSWGNTGAASEILNEIICGPVISPNYDKMTAELAAKDADIERLNARIAELRDMLEASHD